MKNNQEQMERTLQNHNIYLINIQYLFITFSPDKL